MYFKNWSWKIQLLFVYFRCDEDKNWLFTFFNLFLFLTKLLCSDVNSSQLISDWKKEKFLDLNIWSLLYFLFTLFYSFSLSVIIQLFLICLTLSKLSKARDGIQSSFDKVTGFEIISFWWQDSKWQGKLKKFEDNFELCHFELSHHPCWPL